MFKYYTHYIQMEQQEQLYIYIYYRASISSTKPLYWHRGEKLRLEAQCDRINKNKLSTTKPHFAGVECIQKIMNFFHGFSKIVMTLNKGLLLLTAHCIHIIHISCCFVSQQSELFCRWWQFLLSVGATRRPTALTRVTRTTANWFSWRRFLSFLYLGFPL